MDHILDHPVWNALISGNSYLCKGNEAVKFFDREVSPFVAMKENNAEHFELLHKAIEHTAPVLLWTPEEINVPQEWKTLKLIEGLQMVYKGKPPTDSFDEIQPLHSEHIEEMLALTRLTDPGPFGTGTILFGAYYGIIKDGALVSMAGQRFRPYGYTEVSAVCTHPRHLGKGYARQLLQYQLRLILAGGSIPFLHVRKDNERAIAVYEAIGFEVRRGVCFYVLQKN